MQSKKKSLIFLIFLLINYFTDSYSQTNNQFYLDTVKSDVKIKNYFSYIDKVIAKYNDTLEYKITEYTLINNNPWIIDSLAAVDYYFQKEKGVIVLNQKDKVLLPKGTVLRIPTKFQNEAIMQNLLQNRIVINVPEYKLRIFNNGLLINESKIRVGKNESRYLASIERYTDLRTKSGIGKVHSTERNPTWINPVDGHKYTETTRDDKVRTIMPITPSITLNINNIVTGQLIHATTNPETLGKAYSNGCMGTNEYDIWYIYYYSPPGVPVEIKYNLDPFYTNDKSDDLKDIYKEKDHKLRKD